MLNPIIHREGEYFAHDPLTRGLQHLFRCDTVNHCPGCGRSYWLVGRFSAECGFCATALPLSQTNRLGTGTFWSGGSSRAEGEWDVS